MEGFTAENAQAIVGDRDKVPDNIHFVTVEVECVTPGQQIPGTTTGYIAGSGRAVVTVAPRNLKQMRDDVEDVSRITAAKEQFEFDIDAEVATRFGRKLGRYARRGEFSAEDARESRERYAANPGSPTEGDREIHELREQVYATTSSSWQAIFQRLNHRAIKPYLSLRVIDDKVVHPENERKQRYAAENAALTAQILRDVMSDAKGKKAAAS